MSQDLNSSLQAHTLVLMSFSLPWPSIRLSLGENYFFWIHTIYIYFSDLTFPVRFYSLLSLPNGEVLREKFLIIISDLHSGQFCHMKNLKIKLLKSEF